MEISEAFSPVRAIRHGVAAVQRAPASLLVGGFLLFLLDSCTSGGGTNTNLQDAFQDGATPEFTAAATAVLVSLVLLGLGVGLVAFLVRCWFLPGWIRLHRHVLETGTEALPVLFRGGDAFGRMLGWRLLFNVIAVGTFVAAALPGLAILGVGYSQGITEAWIAAGLLVIVAVALPVQIYVGTGILLGDYAVALEGLGPVGALDRSWELARGNRLSLLVFFAVTTLFTFAGLLLCCVGVFFTLPVAQVGMTEAFLLATVPGAERWVVPRDAGL